MLPKQFQITIMSEVNQCEWLCTVKSSPCYSFCFPRITQAISTEFTLFTDFRFHGIEWHVKLKIVQFWKHQGSYISCLNLDRTPGLHPYPQRVRTCFQQLSSGKNIPLEDAIDQSESSIPESHVIMLHKSRTKLCLSDPPFQYTFGLSTDSLQTL